MTSKIIFILLAGFWVAMNVLLWRAEYGAHGGESPVPVSLVWKKILTAPDPSLLSVYQNGDRMGFCEFNTSVEQEMAKLEEDKLPPEGLVASAGYKIRLSGNVSFGDFTNRLKFDGRISFNTVRQWREINLKITARNVTAEIHALATNDNFHVILSGNEINGDIVLRYSDLNNPAALMSEVGKNFGFGGWPGDFELPLMAGNSSAIARSVQWQAHRERLMIGGDPVTAYRLETRVLENPVVLHISTLGEILRVELPAGVIAKLDGWSKS